MRTKEFFDLVTDGELTATEVHNYIEKTTGHDYNKLLLFYWDFDKYFLEKKEELAVYANHNEIRQTLNILKDEGEHLPKPDDELDFSSEMDRISDNYNVDIESVFFSNELEPFYRFRRLLFDLLEQNESNQSLKTDLNYIEWLEPGKSLERFINALQEQNLIKSKETEAIIQEHFKPQKEQNEEPEPIKWLETIALLAYMIESLDRYYIKPENIWSDTAPHFSIKGETPKNLRQTANRFKQNKTRKPKNHEVIDSIIQSLSD